MFITAIFADIFFYTVIYLMERQAELESAESRPWQGRALTNYATDALLLESPTDLETVSATWKAATLAFVLW